MHTEDFKFIDYDIISELVFHEKPYIKEFAEATEQSFTEFQSKYRKFLLKRDEVNFRKAGHKIKPVAQMLKINVVLEEYEHAKTLLWDEKEQKELEKSADKIDKICDRIISELKIIQEDL